MYQSQEKGCGYAAVKMMLCHVYRSLRFRYLEEPSIGDQAPSLADLIAYGAKQGLLLSAFKTREPRGLLSLSTFPFLAVLEEGGKKHLVYVACRRGRRFLLLDPARGKRTFREEEMLALFDGEFLTVLRFVKGGKLPKKKRLVPLLDDFLSCAFPCLQALCFALGALAFFGGRFPLLAIAIAIGLVLPLAQLFHEDSAMKRFDQRYLFAMDRGNETQRKKNFGLYFEFKGLAFSALPSILSKVLAALLIMSALFLKGPLCGALGPIATAVVVLDQLLSGRIFEKASEKLETMESAYLSSREGEEARKAVLSHLGTSSRRLSLAFVGKKVVDVLLSGVLVFVFLFLQEEVAFESFLPLFVIVEELSRMERSVFSEAKRLEKKRMLEGAFWNMVSPKYVK